MNTDSKFDPSQILADGPLEDVRNFLGGVGTEAVGEFFGSLPLSLLLLGRSMFKSNDGGVQGVNVKKEDNLRFMQAALKLRDLCKTPPGQYHVYDGFFHYLACGNDISNANLFGSLVKTMSRVEKTDERAELLLQLLEKVGLSLESKQRFGFTAKDSASPLPEELVGMYERAVPQLEMYVNEASSLATGAALRQFTDGNARADKIVSTRMRKVFGLPTKSTKSKKKERSH
jgi:hypothetical protein